MNDLLALAVEAHGGLERWNSFTKLRASLSITGAIWDFKQVPGILIDKVFEIETHRERLTISPFGSLDTRSVFDAGRVEFQKNDDTVVESWPEAEASFKPQQFTDPWQPFQAAFFASEALWTYLTSPFLYTYPGFESEEIEPWQENGEEWRRLKVTFPEDIVSHTRTQITHFGPDGLMRRHDYTVDILHGNSGANYTTDYRDFQGITMPTKRRIFAYDQANQKIPEPLLVAIDFAELSFN